ncbi:MAG: peptide deformylase [Firmicutes bacterium]|nr:peptide deformylase [Bacillota bacterium]
MAIYMVLKAGEPILREKSKPVKKITPNILKLLDNMAETMYHSEGVGLAAPQIGVPKRVIVVDAGNGLIELINPVVVWEEGDQIGKEGCLSLPGVTRLVKRALKVKVEGIDRNGEPVEILGEGMLSRVLLHEIDHLDGILFIDRALDRPIGH